MDGISVTCRESRKVFEGVILVGTLPVWTKGQRVDKMKNDCQTPLTLQAEMTDKGIQL